MKTTRPRLRGSQLRQYWRNLVDKNQVVYFARAPTGPTVPRAPAVEHLFSTVFDGNRGYRYYAFKDLAQLEKFLSEYPQGQRCNNPYS